jgi:tetrahydromethanopterin S-methyltransferase subunit E
VTFTLTVFVAVTVGAGFGCAVSVAVAVTVTAGFTLSAAGFASVPLFWPSAPAPMPRKKAKPIAGSTYRFRAHFGAVRTGGCGGGGGMYG